MTPSCTDCGKPISRASRTGKCWDCVYPRERHASIAAMRQSGKSVAEVCKAFGISEQAVFYALRKVTERAPSPVRHGGNLDIDPEKAREGSRRLLEGYARYYEDHVAGEAA
jgi:transposase-like protein